MKAMILCAGRGTRMGELTKNTPKPLLSVGGQSLIERRIVQLAAAGVVEIVVNLHYFEDQFRQHLGDGSRLGVKIQYSLETTVLETAGGVIQVLPLLGEGPFIIASGDTLTDFPFEQLMGLAGAFGQSDQQAHLILAPNPSHHPAGDYALKQGQLTLDASPRYNYAGFGLLKPELFAGCSPGFQKLSVLFEKAILSKKATGALFQGLWINVDTAERLALARQKIT
jgi:N-acetyl-alpha-D-muramate 1-phosphate uridylyltransferase